MAKKKDNIRAIVAKSVALKHGVRTDFFYKVVRGDREDDELLADAFDLEKAIKNTIEAYRTNRLIEAVGNLHLFN